MERKNLNEQCKNLGKQPRKIAYAAPRLQLDSSPRNSSTPHPPLLVTPCFKYNTSPIPSPILKHGGHNLHPPSYAQNLTQLVSGVAGYAKTTTMIGVYLTFIILGNILWRYRESNASRRMQEPPSIPDASDGGRGDLLW